MKPTVTTAVPGALSVEDLQHSVDHLRDEGDPRSRVAVRTEWSATAAARKDAAWWQVNAGRRLRQLRIPLDTPADLPSADGAPTSRHLLLIAVNACVLESCVIACRTVGIDIATLEVRTEGCFNEGLGLCASPELDPAPASLRVTIRIGGETTPEQLRELHRRLAASSPLFGTLINPVEILC